MIERIIDLLISGGFVMLPLIIASAILWYALGVRFAILKKSPHQFWDGMKQNILEGDLGDFFEYAKRIQQSSSSISLKKSNLNERFLQLQKKISVHGSLITTIVMISPLLGLLGTVTGMIETFDSLGDNSLFSQGGGIAGGIGQALISTQMGLIVAIPGHLLGKFLKRRESEILHQAEHIMEWSVNKNKELLNA